MNNSATGVLLGIDTSSRKMRLGLTFGGDRLVQSDEESERSHGQFIIKKIGELFQSASLEPTVLEGIVVCTGPGSFTGLRIGLAAAKGMVMALDIPLIAVTVFEIAATRLKQIKGTVHVVVPLNRDECIVGQVEDGETDPGLIRVVKYNQLFDVVRDDAVAATGFRFHERYPQAPTRDYTNQLDWQAADLLYLGRDKLARNEVPDPATLEPLYLQKSQAEIRFEKNQRPR